MDIADLAIEGAGFALIITLLTGAFAIAYTRRRLVLGVCLGLGLALLALPFATYLVARLTNHHATDLDLAPPAYIVATALICGGLALLGVLGGAIAELRPHPPAPSPSEMERGRSGSGAIDRAHRPPAIDRAHATPAKLGPEQDGNDDPALWIPWMRPHPPAPSPSADGEGESR